MYIFILCVKIFCVRIIDVSLGTVRTLFTVKGKNFVASCIGFFEILVWFLIVKEALNTDEESIFIAISYALGFATGTYVGGMVSDLFMDGTLGVFVTLSSKDQNVVKAIRKAGYVLSVIDVKGYDKEKYLLLLEVDKKRINKLKKLINSLDSKAFLVVNETKYVQNGF